MYVLGLICCRVWVCLSVSFVLVKSRVFGVVGISVWYSLFVCLCSSVIICVLVMLCCSFGYSVLIRWLKCVGYLCFSVVYNGVLCSLVVRVLWVFNCVVMVVYLLLGDGWVMMWLVSSFCVVGNYIWLNGVFCMWCMKVLGRFVFEYVC